MPYDEDLAHRIRELLAGEDGVTEQRMFGGLAFLIGGNMAVAASSKGGLMVRVDPDEQDALLEQPGTGPMVMGGRSSRGWLRVDADSVATRQRLAAWVERGASYARALPAKG